LAEVTTKNLWHYNESLVRKAGMIEIPEPHAPDPFIVGLYRYRNYFVAIVIWLFILRPWAKKNFCTSQKQNRKLKSTGRTEKVFIKDAEKVNNL
jgi:hypothetical protein